MLQLPDNYKTKIENDLWNKTISETISKLNKFYISLILRKVLYRFVLIQTER